MNTSKDLSALLGDAVSTNVISQPVSDILNGNIDAVVIAGAEGKDVEDVDASAVTLLLLLVDKSSSMSGLEGGVKDGQQVLLKEIEDTADADSILVSVWTYNQDQNVIHSFLPVEEAIRLDGSNYRASGMTSLYDTYVKGVNSLITYAQDLEAAGTPTRSIVVLVTDGEDTSSRNNFEVECAKINEDLLRSEKFVLGFVGLSRSSDDSYFTDIAEQMGFPPKAIRNVKNMDRDAIKDMFHMISRQSVSVSKGNIQPGQNSGLFS